MRELSSRFVLNLRMTGENCLIFNWHSSRAALGSHFLEYQQRMMNTITVQPGETTLLQLLLVIR